VTFCGASRGAAALQELPSIEDFTAGATRLDGLVTLYWNDDSGSLYLEVPELDRELLYVSSLSQGVGSNDLGLDRAQLGRTHVVFFRRVGRKVLMVQPNYAYRAESQNAAERRAVDEAFARSVLWGFELEARSDDRLLVDATDFLLRDSHGIGARLARASQGTYKVDASRSAVHLPRTRAFPRNTEIDVLLTLVGTEPGALIRSVTPTAEALSVNLHHSFVALPEPGFRTREHDPRAGFNSVSYEDFAAPLSEPSRRRLAARHRLEKADPSAALSDPVEPIVYYLDPGTPEPVRSALLDGARWWNEAFEAAGYRNAFQVEMLPEGADPMDVRYNTITWIHRSTRGWSYGSSVIDPRTGEILKGHVSLGSLRARQDLLIAEGLLAPYGGDDTQGADRAEEMVLARIRQLSAHEVGHTLGLAHNYLASSQGQESVMDYPHPVVRLTDDGEIDLSQAYAVGIGEWDKVSIEWGYRHFPETVSESDALEGILDAARRRGLGFLSDQDARPAGSAHPRVHLWDNGSDPVAELRRVMRVRRAALDRFGEQAIRFGRPLATLEEALVPLYLHHRYQVAAAAKVVGGQYYGYALRGDGQEPARPAPAPEQREALSALLVTLQPAELAIPVDLLPLLPPRPLGFPAHRELFGGNTSPSFDPVQPAAVAADATLALLLQPQRAARLVVQSSLDPGLPGLDEVLAAVGDAVLPVGVGADYPSEIARTVRWVYVDRLIALAESAAMPQVRALARTRLAALPGELAARGGVSAAEDAHRALLEVRITRHLSRPAVPAERPAVPQAPPGSPIGTAAEGLAPSHLLACDAPL
jgi:hypothetical protein